MSNFDTSLEGGCDECGSTHGDTHSAACSHRNDKGEHPRIDSISILKRDILDLTSKISGFHGRLHLVNLRLTELEKRLNITYYAPEQCTVDGEWHSGHAIRIKNWDGAYPKAGELIEIQSKGYHHSYCIMKDYHKHPDILEIFPALKHAVNDGDRVVKVPNPNHPLAL